MQEKESRKNLGVKQLCKITVPPRELPPSTGERSSTVEILYSLEVSVTVDRILKRVIRKSQQINFCPIASLQTHPQPLIHRQEVTFRCKNENKDTVENSNTYQVKIELIRGQHLILGQCVPINVNITQNDSTNDDIILSDYQAMLIEETASGVGAQPRVQRLFSTLKTMSNLNIAAKLAEKMPGATVTLSDSAWGPHSLPTTITPTFETCNIRRTYKLHVRLGLKGGPKMVGHQYLLGILH